MAQDDLIERRDGFNYDFRMRCECGGSSFLSARDYAAEINQAHMVCEVCGADIHFGRAVIAIRAEQDVALDNALAPRLAWYHSSTWPDWPSTDFAKQAEAERRATRRRWSLGHGSDPVPANALHLGTYEAAVENMLRRMHDQADGAAQFHLYRVQLRHGLRIEAGYRDENLLEASRLTVHQMESAGFDVVRYLNAYEAEGTLSLAVQPHAIAAVQRVAIPIAETIDPGPLDERLGLAHELAVDQSQANVASERLNRIPIQERKLMRLGLRPDPEDLARTADDLQLEVYKKWHTFEDELARLYLAGVSPIVIREFQGALSSWRAASRNSDPETFVLHFRRTAALVSDPASVIRLLALQPRRELPAPPDFAETVGATG